MNIGAMIALVVISEAFLHYFPWRKFLKGRELPRVAAYVLGILGLAIPFTAWLFELREYQMISMLWLVIVAGGGTVFALYGLDHVIELEWKVREGTEREVQLKEQVSGKGK
jgi:uncharacterized membrane protein